MKKYLYLALIVTCLAVLLAGCGCEHEWNEATCIAPKTCKLCDHTESVTYDLAEHTPTGHISFHNDCIYSYDAWYCAVCGYNHVEYLGYGEHAWSNYGIFSDRYVCRYCGVSKEDSENQEKLQTMKDILISPPVPVNP